MLETGKIITVKGRRALVALPLKDGCSGCGRCTLGRGRKNIQLEAENISDASVGDTVSVEVPHRDPLAAAGLLFGLPLLGLVAGAIAGSLLARWCGSKSQAPAMIIGIVFLLASFLLVKIREKKLAKRLNRRVRIVRILEADSSPEA